VCGVLKSGYKKNFDGKKIYLSQAVYFLELIKISIFF